MDVLALDLGRTTGYACFRKDKVRTFGYFVDADEGFVALRSLGPPDHVIVEKPIVIKGPLGDEMAGLIARTEAEYGDKIFYVTASQWKPHPLSKKVRKKLRGHTVHEKDAICIGAWFLFVHLQVEA